MAWFDLAILSAVHVKIGLTLLGTMLLYGALTTSDRVPARQRAFARVRRQHRSAAK
jgi:thiosulfate reductase cytochrome b subunit